MLFFYFYSWGWVCILLYFWILNLCLICWSYMMLCCFLKFLELWRLIVWVSLYCVGYYFCKFYLWLIVSFFCKNCFVEDYLFCYKFMIGFFFVRFWKFKDMGLYFLDVFVFWFVYCCWVCGIIILIIGWWW